MPETTTAVPASENGKHKLVIREREYEMLSWSGLKMMTSVVAAVSAAVISVLVAYYSAEAGQNDLIDCQDQNISVMTERLRNQEKVLIDAFARFDITMLSQRDMIDKTRETLIRVDTTQQELIKSIDRLSMELRQRIQP